jgi:hypothetical protein
MWVKGDDRTRSKPHSTQKWPFLELTKNADSFLIILLKSLKARKGFPRG